MTGKSIKILEKPVRNYFVIQLSQQPQHSNDMNENLSAFDVILVMEPIKLHTAGPITMKTRNVDSINTV